MSAQLIWGRDLSAEFDNWNDAEVGLSGRKPRPLLFEPMKVRGLTLRNRIIASPMCQYRSIDGAPTDWHLAHLGRLAIGGAGVVFYEETAVEARGRKTYDCAGIRHDQHVAAFNRVSRLIREIGSVPAIQLGHAGGRASSHGAARDWAPLTEADASTGRAPWVPVSASPVSLGAGRPICHELDRDEIQSIVWAWAAAARRCDEAGFDILEIHGAHGYLIHQFLSPVTNQRTDAYGGDRNGRMRLALEIVEAVRSIWPTHKPLFFRVSCLDGRGGLWDLEDTVALARDLGQRGVDAVDCSSGGISGGSSMPVVPRVPGYHVGYAKHIRSAANIMTIAVGLITEAYQAEEILSSGCADLVALARELMYHADWPVHAGRALGIPDYFSLFPPEYAFRLRRREEIAKLQINAPATRISESAVQLIEST